MSIHVGTATTLPGLLIERAASSPNVVALRFHDLGIWNEMTWSKLLENVALAGDALASVGVKADDVVALVAKNRPAWLVADLAIQGLGASSLVLRPDLSPATVSRLCAERGVTVAIVGDQEQYDKFTVAADGAVAPLRIVIDGRGISPSDLTGPTAMTWDGVLNRASVPAVWLSAAGSLDPHSVATYDLQIDRTTRVAPISRTQPRTSSELLSAADQLAITIDAHAGDELYPFASMAETTERLLCEVLMLRLGSTVNIGEGGELTLLESRAVQPTVAHVPSSVLHSMRADIVTKRARFGLRRIAVDRLLTSSVKPSARSARPDFLITFGLLATWAFGAIVVHNLLRSTNGAIRLLIIAGAGIAMLAVLVVGGFGVRPFLRKAYGLARARTLLTGNDLDSDTIRLLDSLRLSPILEGPPTMSPTTAAFVGNSESAATT
jgi:AMP-binding enzyme